MQSGLPALLCTVVAFILFGSSNTQSVTQSPPSLNKQEGESVTLDCRFTLSYTYYVMSWFRQLSNGKMTQVIYLYSGNTKDRKGRYSVSHQARDRTISLTITDLMPTDSGVYFCAVGEAYSSGGPEYWGYDAPLIFGAGTRLIVEPKNQDPAKPSVFIMRNGTTVACLVKDFYPKDIDIKLESTKKLEEFDPAIVVSPSGKYSAVKLGRYEDPNTVTCLVEHNSEVVSSTNFEPKTDSSGTGKPKPTEPENIELTPKSISELKATGRHSSQFTARNVNMLSLTVLGLRMVFAKSLAINFLLTAKLFFF